MISPELLRRYPFFSSLDDVQVKAIATLSDEVSCAANQRIFEAGQAADRFYFLIAGSIDLYFLVENAKMPDHEQFLYVGHLNPEEPFGVSALIEPYHYAATAVTSSLCRILTIKADGLRALCETDERMALVLMRHLAKVAMSRLHAVAFK